jgi:alpha-D-ribose 1-methylphosphonate 5-triphosphate synthase subunit PhnH
MEDVPVEQTEPSQKYGLADYTQLFTPPHADPAEHAARATFTALMWALSYPGRVYSIVESKPVADLGRRALDPTERFAATRATCLAIGHTLLDLETSYYTPDTDLSAQLAATSSRRAPAAQAAYHIYPTAESSPSLLADMSVAHVGDFLYPDRAATLIVGCRLGEGPRLFLQGPGIATTATAQIDGLPDGFWEVRAEAIHYPLGWDLFLVDGDFVLGLPRTTVVSA